MCAKCMVLQISGIFAQVIKKDRTVKSFKVILTTWEFVIFVFLQITILSDW